MRQPLTLLALFLAATWAQEKEIVNAKSAEAITKPGDKNPRMHDIMDQVDKVMEQPERLLDVRQMIRDTLDIMRSYPTPKVISKLPEELRRQQQQEQLQAYYAQQQQKLYPRRAYGAQTYRPVSSTSELTNDDATLYPRIQQTTATTVPTASVDATAQQLTRLFATPSQQDMERLFHLPADIMHRLASDAGYIQPHEEPEEIRRRESYDGRNPAEFVPRASFSLSGEGDDLSTFIAKLSSQTPHQDYQPEPTTAIPIASPPRIVMRTVQQGNRIIQLPVLVVPQQNGQNRYIQYEKLSDLSEALSKAISTGQLQLPAEQQRSTVPQPERIIHRVDGLPGSGRSSFNDMFGHGAAVQIEPPTTVPSPIRAEIASESKAFIQAADPDSVEKEAEQFARNAPSPDLTALTRILQQNAEMARQVNIAPSSSAFGIVDGHTDNEKPDFPQPPVMEEMEKQAHEEISTTSRIPSTTQEAVKSTTKSAAEILLNGHRYRLIEVNSAEKEESATEIPVSTPPSNSAVESSSKAADDRKSKKITVKTTNIDLSRSVYGYGQRQRGPTIRKALPANDDNTKVQAKVTTESKSPHRVYSLRELGEFIENENADSSTSRALTSAQLLAAAQRSSVVD